MGPAVDSPAAAVDVSVVVPVYGCDQCLPELVRRLRDALSATVDSFEVVFVEDRSPDRSWDVLSTLVAEYRFVRAMRLSRNFGQQVAITAGLAASRGRWTVVMDCDLQDPPELIPRLLAKAQSGYDVVLARRIRHGHSRPRLFFARAYFLFLRSILGVSVSGDYGAFSLVSAKAREALLRIPDVDRHYVPMLLWVGFEQTSIEFEQGERFAGTSAYSFGTLVRLAMEGLFFQTTTLLRWVVYAGFGVAAVGVALAIFFVVAHFWFHPYPGWTSLAVLFLLIGGFIIVSTGVTGLYIGKIFRQVKGRPLYLVDEELSGESR